VVKLNFLFHFSNKHCNKRKCTSPGTNPQSRGQALTPKVQNVSALIAHFKKGWIMVIEAIGRRLRLAVIGGGPGSVIGEVHRIAARLDGYYDIVAATLSSDPERARRAGIAIGVPEDRAYPSAQALIEGEAERADRADVIAVMTPNDSHYEICSLALDAGFHVVCDKPLTTDLSSAVSLARKVKAAGNWPSRRVS
jgi:Oxidoreductase family, NAD-binding Rossmann fold